MITKQMVLLGMSVLLFLCPVAALADPVDDAARAIGRGDYGTARRLLDGYLTSGAVSNERLGLASYYRAQAAGRVSKREFYLKQAIASPFLPADRRPEVLLELTRLYLLKGNLELAEHFSHRITSEFPTSPQAPDAVYYTAYCRIRKGNTDQAIAYLRQLTRAYPDYAQLDRVEAALAEALCQEKKYDDAVRVLMNMIIGYPETSYKSWIYLQLGECYRQLADVSQALAAYHQVLDRYPESIQAPLARAALAELSPSASAVDVNPAIRPPGRPDLGQPTIDVGGQTSGTGQWRFSAAGSYTVQVVALTDAAQAERQASGYKGAGYPIVDIQQALVNGTSYYRVRLGRFDSRSEADRYRAELARRGLNGFIARW